MADLKKIKKQLDVIYTKEQIKMYKKGWNDAMLTASNIAGAIDSNRGNEKEIVTHLKASRL